MTWEVLIVVALICSALIYLDIHFHSLLRKFHEMVGCMLAAQGDLIKRIQALEREKEES